MRVISRRITSSKLNIYSMCMYTLWSIYCTAFFLLQQSEIQYMYQVSEIYKAISYIVVFGLFALIVSTFKFTPKQLLIYFVITLLMLFSILKLKDTYLIIVLGFIFCATKIDLKRFIEFDIKLKVFILGLIVGLCLLGIINNYETVINGVHKQSLGFGHPNSLANFVMVILIEWIYIRYEKMKFYDFSCIIIILLIISKIAAARSSIISFIMIMIMLLFIKKNYKILKNNIVKLVVIFFTPICIGISFILVDMYSKGNIMALKINDILTHRLRLAYQVLNAYGISLFGQHISVKGTRTLATSDALFGTVDMAYIVVATKYGVVILLLLCIGYFLLNKYSLKNNEYGLILAICYFNILGFGETYFYRIQYNFTLLFLLIYLKNVKSKMKTSRYKMR